MRFLFITQNYPPSKGGMSVSCERIIKNFRKKGIDVDIIHFTNRKKRFITQPNINGTYTVLPIENSEEFTLTIASEFILRLPFIKETTHIIAFGGTLPVSIAPILSKYISKPLITCIRGNDFDEGIFSKRREKLLFTLENSSFVFSVTDEKREKINKLISHNNTFFTPNGINEKYWKSSKSHEIKTDILKKSFSKKTIGIVGQLKAKKGIVNFFETFNKFAYKDQYCICLIGDIAEQTQAIINTFEINTQYFKFASQNELITYYNAFDYIAIPSFYDGMPNVLLEAGITKNVIIGADIGGIKDVIENEKDGFLYNPFHPTDLLDTLLKVHRLSNETKQTIAKNLYQKISNDYTEEKEINTYLKLLNYEN